MHSIISPYVLSFACLMQHDVFHDLHALLKGWGFPDVQGRGGNGGQCCVPRRSDVMPSVQWSLPLSSAAPPWTADQDSACMYNPLLCHAFLDVLSLWMYNPLFVVHVCAISCAFYGYVQSPACSVCMCAFPFMFCVYVQFPVHSVCTVSYTHLTLPTKLSV